MMTPLESRSDVTVRTLNNPLKSCFRSGLLAHRSGAAWSEDDVIKPLAWLPPGLPPCCCARVLSRSMHACVHVRGAGFDEGRSSFVFAASSLDSHVRAVPHKRNSKTFVAANAPSAVRSHGRGPDASGQVATTVPASLRALPPIVLRVKPWV